MKKLAALAAFVGLCFALAAPAGPITLDLKGARGGVPTGGGGGSGAPAYISALAPFQQLSLASVTNGNEVSHDVTHSSWLTDPQGMSDKSWSMYVAWSGGPKAISGTRFWIHGEGHSDGSNNELLEFDLAGTTMPTGWVRRAGSVAGAFVNCADAYSDGAPTAIHSYDGMVYAHANDTIYRFGGAWACDAGQPTDGVWKFANASGSGGSWVRLTDYPGGAQSQIETVYNPSAGTAGKIFVTKASGGYFLDLADDSWSSNKTYSNGITKESGLAYDSVRSRALSLTATGAIFFTINWTTPSVTSSTCTASGDTAILAANGVSAIYDELLDKYWLTGGSGVSDPDVSGTGQGAGWDTIYEMHPTTCAITAHTLTGDDVKSTTADQHGTYGRYLYNSAWRVIATVPMYNQPVVVIRLPSSSTLDVGTVFDHLAPANDDDFDAWRLAA